MIKECNVLINNELVTVVRFGDIDVQLPSIHRNAETVRVQYADGHYRVVSDDYKEPEQESIPAKSKRKSSKKTTIEKVAKSAEKIITIDSADSK